MLGPGLTFRARVVRTPAPIGALVLALTATAVVAVAPRRALATGESITDVRVLDNQRTEEGTIRSIAGVSIGETLEADTLDRVRERLNTSGLFSDINVWWEPNGAGVRVNIAVKEKFPWAPLPTGTWSANNKALGLVFVHGNLFGRGKQMVLGARIATVDSGALLAYRDPAIMGSWFYWQMQAVIQRQVLPEYDNSMSVANPLEVRETNLLSYGIEPSIGIAWFRRVKTQVIWHLEHFNLNGSDVPAADSGGTSSKTLAATNGGTIGVGRALLSFDFRAREFAVMTGASLSGLLEYSSPSFGSDFTYWRAGVGWEHGIRFFRQANLIYSAYASAGHNLPFWAETTAGGNNDRGYLYQQFRGDTQLSGKAEYHFPLFSIGSLDFRALGFYDVAAVWYREPLPTMVASLAPPVGDGVPYRQRDTPDQRSFPNAFPQGFSWNQSVHNSVGAGLRFFLRSVAVPLIGFDAGYGLEAKQWRFILVIGA
jgi:outer membrane protein assembly factor BamA